MEPNWIGSWRKVNEAISIKVVWRPTHEDAVDKLGFTAKRLYPHLLIINQLWLCRNEYLLLAWQPQQSLGIFDECRAQ